MSNQVLFLVFGFWFLVLARGGGGLEMKVSYGVRT